MAICECSIGLLLCSLLTSPPLDWRAGTFLFWPLQATQYLHRAWHVVGTGYKYVKEGTEEEKEGEGRLGSESQPGT